MTPPQLLPRLETKGPVDWALGKVLIDTLLKPLLYSFVPDRADPRDWMTGSRVDLPLPQAAAAGEPESSQDYWFDFIADTGDSESSLYSLSYLFHGDIALSDPNGSLSEPAPRISERHAVVPRDTRHAFILPRGEFLFVGGDTAYPVADWATVKQRFLAPMNHAFRQRFPDGAPPPRPLLGIPGNHDWYDSLDAFGRLFRLPVVTEAVPAAGTSAPLAPEGYFPLQSASYFSMQLPGGWTFWALDARDGKDVDFRQKAFFTDEPAPRRLLLATPNPAFVSGAKAGWVDGLVDDVLRERSRALRLWFSGDTHHYARYERAPLSAEHSITSLVSGLGGASLHAPNAEGIAAARTYPSVREATQVITRAWRFRCTCCSDLACGGSGPSWESSSARAPCKQKVRSDRCSRSWSDATRPGSSGGQSYSQRSLFRGCGSRERCGPSRLKAKRAKEIWALASSTR